MNLRKEFEVKKCFIYIRVSTDEQAKHGASLDAQKAVCEEYAATHGWQVQNIFVDEGISAKSTEKRVQYLEMISRLNEVDLILCWKDDRLLRNPADAVNLSTLLSKTKTELYTVEKGRFKLELPDEEFMFILASALGRRELLVDSQRIKNVAREQTKKGYVVSGQIPFGYVAVGEKGKRKLEIDEENAAVIKQIFNDYENNNSLSLTARKNNITIGKTKGILKCKQYIGIYDNPKRDLYVEDYCPPIIDKEQFYNVQRLLKMNVKRPRTNRVYLFSGLIICGECGRKYTTVIDAISGKSTKEYKRYRCFRGRERVLCDNNHGIGEIKLEKILLSELKAEFENRQIEAIVQQKEKVNLKKEKAKLQNQQKKIVDLYLDEIIDRAEYERRYNTLKAEIENLTAKEEASGISQDTLQAVLSPSFDETYNSYTDKQKKRFWRSVVDKITVYKNGDIIIKFL